jgi:ABC-2 type transport system ATP-binding protein
MSQTLNPKAPALRIENLIKKYSNLPVVNQLNFEIQQGEIFGLLGPNGAGKSTTINMISGVTRIGAGKIEAFGYDNQKDYLITRRLTGVMHQEVIMDNFFPIGQTLAMFAGFYGAEDDPKWRNLLVDRLDLRPHLKKKMIKLSGGMKRRFMIAKALIHKPKLLILDEPTAGVDVELRHTLWEFIREINAQGTTVLLTTHYLEEAEQMCHRVAIMNFGELVALERTKDLIEQVGEKKLILNLDVPLSTLPGPLSSYDVTLENQGRTLSVILKQDQKEGALLKLAFDSNLQIESIEKKQPDLEEVFLKLTGQK